MQEVASKAHGGDLNAAVQEFVNTGIRRMPFVEEGWLDLVARQCKWYWYGALAAWDQSRRRRGLRTTRSSAAAALDRALSSLGYNSMASATAPTRCRCRCRGGPVRSPSSRPPALPSSHSRASTALCLVQHIAMGCYRYAEVASAATMMILKVEFERGPFGVYYARIYAGGVEVPGTPYTGLYHDGRYVVHGILLPPLNRTPVVLSIVLGR